MLREDFKQAIKIIHRLFSENNIQWALIGSTNTQLQGMNVNPRDLDLVVKLDNLEQTRRIFSEYHTSEIKELPAMTDEPGWEVTATIANVQIQFLGERDTGEYVSKLLAKKITRIPLDDIDIPCFTLEAEAQAYAETRREKKAERIEEFLEAQMKQNYAPSESIATRKAR